MSAETERSVQQLHTLHNEMGDQRINSWIQEHVENIASEANATTEHNEPVHILNGHSNCP